MEDAMPNITMLDIEQLRTTKLRPYIDKCLEHRAPDPGFHAMMGHNVDLCEAMFVAWDACFTTRPSVMMEQQDLVTPHSNHSAHRRTSSIRPRPKTRQRSDRPHA